MENVRPSAEILAAYAPLMHLDSSVISTLGSNIAIPKPTGEMLMGLCQSAARLLASQKALIWIDGPITVVGDLHGNLNDLLRILSSVDDPAESKFLFLGDYVDRGNYQTEVITLLLALMVEYPSKYFLIRGNHEVASVNQNYGFQKEITASYTMDVWSAFNDVFTYLPLAAVVNNSYFCVHGGLSPHLKTLNDIESLPMPILDTTSQMITDMLWSDPVNSLVEFRESKRGIGVNFGVAAVDAFLAANNLQGILRAHENIPSGIKRLFHGKLITIFSSSGYSSLLEKGGFLGIEADGNFTYHYFSPGRIVPRAEAQFKPIQSRRLLGVKSFMGNFRFGEKKKLGVQQTQSLHRWPMRLRTPVRTFEASSPPPPPPDPTNKRATVPVPPSVSGRIFVNTLIVS